MPESLTIQKIADAAGDSINQTPAGITPSVGFVFPGAKWTKSGKHKIGGENSPQGDIVNEDEYGIYVIFDAIDVLAWAVANGAQNQYSNSQFI